MYGVVPLERLTLKDLRKRAQGLGINIVLFPTRQDLLRMVQDTELLSPGELQQRRVQVPLIIQPLPVVPQVPVIVPHVPVTVPQVPVVPPTPMRELTYPRAPLPPPHTIPTDPLYQEALKNLRFLAYPLMIYSPSPMVDLSDEKDTPAGLAYLLFHSRKLKILNPRYQLDQSEPYTVEHILARGDGFTLEVLRELGLSGLAQVDKTVADLLWWFNISTVKFLQPKEVREYLSRLDTNTLIGLLGRTYQKSPERSQVLFAALTGNSTRENISHILHRARYQSVLKYPPYAVILLMYYVWYGEHSISSPYDYVADRPVSPFEALLLTYTNENALTLTQALQIVFPQGITTEAQKKNYFLTHLNRYQYLYERPPDLSEPPLQKDLTRENLHLLNPYTDQELIDFYGLPQPYTWNSRDGLLGTILRLDRKDHWRLLHKRCRNEDTINIVSGERHALVDKDEEKNPTVSYGTSEHYRCYQVDELEASFRDYEGIGFRFRVPDEDRDHPYPDFSVESIRELERLLLDQPRRGPYEALINKIREGFDQLGAGAVLLRRLQREYQSLNPNDQAHVQRYLAWLFTFAMWLRYWKGPGNAWPVKWAERGGQTIATHCDLATRDENAKAEFGVRTRLLYEMSPEAQNFVLRLPRVKYDWRTGQSTIAQRSPDTPEDLDQNIDLLNFIVYHVIIGRYCMADASDTISQAAYYLITKLLNFNNTQLNTWLRGWIAAPNQPEFNPLQMAKTGHVEFIHRVPTFEE